VHDGGQWSSSPFGYFKTGKKPPKSHRVGGSVRPEVGLDTMEEKRKILLLLVIEPLLFIT
jgi:hypothetical protein